VLLDGTGIRRVALTGGAALLAIGGGTTAAVAATAHYASFDFGAGTVSVPAAGFPAGHITTNSTSPSSPSGASAFLNSSTPFGQAFGSSQNQPYALLRLASGRAPSTTTVTFDSAPASGTWGFALGDVDAENVRIHAYGPGGVALPVSDLGFQSTFNYCNGSPLPSTCKGTSTDVPTWHPSSGTLHGNSADTDGAAGWFRPNVPITKLVFHATHNTGIPAFQLWIAAEDQPKPPPTTPPTTPPKPETVPPTEIPLVTSPGEPVTVPVCSGSARDIDVTKPPQHGTVTTDAPNCSVTYTPGTGYSGPDTFTLKITESNGKTVVKRFDVEVGLAKTGLFHLSALGATGGALLLFGGALTMGVRRFREH